MIHYTCMHCGKVTNLPDDKRETVITCPACQFSNWVSGMAIAEPEPPSPRFRQEAPPPARPVAKPPQAPHPALGRPAPQRPAGSASHPQISQPHPAPKTAPPPAPRTAPSPLSPPQAKPPGQAPPKAPPPGQPGASPPKPQSGLDRHIELLQRKSAPPARPPQYQPRPTGPENQRSEICPQAIGAFVLGVFSMLSLAGPIPLTVIVSLVTLALAGKAKTKIDAEPTRFRGAGLATLAGFLGAMGLICAVFVKGCR